MPNLGRIKHLRLKAKSQHLVKGNLLRLKLPLLPTKADSLQEQLTVEATITVTVTAMTTVTVMVTATVMETVMEMEMKMRLQK